MNEEGVVIPYIPQTEFSVVIDGGTAIGVTNEQRQKIINGLEGPNSPMFIQIGENMYARRTILGILDKEATESVIYAQSNYRKCGGCGTWIPPKMTCGRCA